MSLGMIGQEIKPPTRAVALSTRGGLLSWNPWTTHLTLGSNPDVTLNRGILAQVAWLLDAQIGQHVLPEDWPGVQVGRHEAAAAWYSLGKEEQVTTWSTQQQLSTTDTECS